MIGDIIGVTHEELGLVYAKVEYINETGDLMVRADNDYMDGGYECTVKECQPIEITEKFLLKNGFAKGQDVSGLFDEYVNDVYALRTDKDKFGMSRTIVRVVPFFDLGFIVRAERTCDDPKLGRHEFYVHRPNTQYIHQIQQTCRLCGIEIDWKL